VAIKIHLFKIIF